jgi:hypothetical protein
VERPADPVFVPEFSTGVEHDACRRCHCCQSPASRNLELIRYINLKLAALGQPTSRSTADPEFLEIAGPLLRNYHQKDQLLGNRLCPADTRIQSFLDSYLRDVSSQRRRAAARR